MSWTRNRVVTIAVAALIAVGAIVAVRGGFNSGSPDPANTMAIAGPGTTLTPLSATQRTRVQDLTTPLVDQMLSDHPQLKGLHISSISPVYTDESTRPVGGMARLVLPGPVPTVSLDLVRSAAGVPELVQSEITNLRALEVIVLLDTGDVVSVAVSPQEMDAVDPATATVVRTLDPERHQGSEFGGSD